MLFLMMMLDSQEEKSKFEQLYEKYNKLMFSVAYKILKDTGAAEDAVQEAFLRIMNSLGKINDPECHNTKVYIVIIIKSIATDMYRKRKRQAAVPLDGDIADEMYEDRVALGQFRQAENRIDMSRCIVRLPDRYREVILLKYYNELSDDEIAAAMGITAVNVRKLLERARKKLAEEYKGEVENGD